jgi:hypothetical protein
MFCQAEALRQAELARQRAAAEEAERMRQARLRAAEEAAAREALRLRALKEQRLAEERARAAAEEARRRWEPAMLFTTKTLSCLLASCHEEASMSEAPCDIASLAVQETCEIVPCMQRGGKEAGRTGSQACRAGAAQARGGGKAASGEGVAAPQSECLACGC